MKSVDIGVLPQSICFSFIPPEQAKELWFFPTWCGHYYCTPQYFMHRESYPPLLIIYVRKGTLHVEYRGESKNAQAGDVVLLDCSEPHYYQALDRLEFLYMHYDGSNSHAITNHIIAENGWLMRAEERGKDGKPVRDKRNEKVNLLLEDMVYLYENRHAETMFESSLRIYRLFEILLTPTEQVQKKQSPIFRTVDYIRANVGKSITLGELSEMANMSTYYYSHQFKKETGFAPLEYIINTRIEHAKTLLLTTDKPISEIAYEVGYASSGSLINVFVKHVGESPLQYRKSHSGLDR